MKKAEKPENEEQRLQSLKELQILDTAIEESYDDITEPAAQICQVPICLISLLDEERQWFKSRYGLDAESTPRDFAFCGHAILQDQLFEVEDSSKDDRFKDNPLATGQPHVKYYAGFPLKTPDNLNLGTLCVIDHKPNKLNEYQIKSLEVLAKQVSNMFELRRSLFRLSKAKADNAALAMSITYAHEINNPLAIATGYTKAIEKEIEKNNKIDIEHMKKVNLSLDRIREVVINISETLRTEGIQIEEYVNKSDMLKLKKNNQESKK